LYKRHPVRRKVLLTFAFFASLAIGGAGALTLRHLISTDQAFITTHRWLTVFVGTVGLLLVSFIARNFRLRNLRVYGLVLLGISCGIFIEAVAYFKPDCKDDCQTYFLLKLAGCVILVVDGFSSYSIAAEEEAASND
jgi:hypothetical protein